MQHSFGLNCKKNAIFPDLNELFLFPKLMYNCFLDFFPVLTRVAAGWSVGADLEATWHEVAAEVALAWPWTEFTGMVHGLPWTERIWTTGFRSVGQGASKAKA